MSNVSFNGQRDGEKVKFIFRRHASTASKGIFFLLICIIIGMLPMFMWPNDGTMFWIFLGFVLLGLLGLGYAYMLWYFSIYIVTNQRIRQINQKGLFKKTIVDLDLDKIQSISINIPGFMAGICGYGTILIQTSAGDLIISMAANPEKIHNKLQDIIKES